VKIICKEGDHFDTTGGKGNDRTKSRPIGMRCSICWFFIFHVLLFFLDRIMLYPFLPPEP
jgi:hypothetical protein